MEGLLKKYRTEKLLSLPNYPTDGEINEIFFPAGFCV